MAVQNVKSSRGDSTPQKPMPIGYPPLHPSFSPSMASGAALIAQDSTPFRCSKPRAASATGLHLAGAVALSAAPCRPPGERGSSRRARNALRKSRTLPDAYSDESAGRMYRSSGHVRSKGHVVSFPGANALRWSPTDSRTDPICHPRPNNPVGWC
jgi:hypothetical protein